MFDWLKAKEEQSTTGEPSFPFGFAARLKVRFRAERKLRYLAAYFRHEADLRGLIVFVESGDMREGGYKTEAVLETYLAEGIPTGRYFLHGLEGSYAANPDTDDYFTLSDIPEMSFLLTNRDGSVGQEKNSARVIRAEWG